MKKEKYPKEYEEYWAANKNRLLREDDEYLQAINSYKMTTGADWLLFGIPVVAGIVSMQFIPIQHEILKWFASIAITILVFALCVFIKSLTNPHRAIEDIETDIKRRNYNLFMHK